MYYNVSLQQASPARPILSPSSSSQHASLHPALSPDAPKQKFQGAFKKVLSKLWSHSLVTQTYWEDSWRHLNATKPPGFQDSTCQIMGIKIQGKKKIFVWGKESFSSSSGPVAGAAVFKLNTENAGSHLCGACGLAGNNLFVFYSKPSH